MKKKSTEKLIERMLDGDYIDAIAGIEKVECRLHKITLSGGYSYPTIVEKIGALKMITDNRSWGLENYREKYIRKFSKFDLLVFLNPIIYQDHIPKPCYFIIIPTREVTLVEHRKFLQFLDDKFHTLGVSECEYTIDFICDDLDNDKRIKKVKKVYDFLVKNMYVPNFHLEKKGKKIIPKTFGGQPVSFENDRIIRGIHIGRYVKIYERGPELAKSRYPYQLVPDEEQYKNKTWVVSDALKVRLEFTLTREVPKNSVKLLANLIDQPKFYQLINRKIQFRYFENKILPTRHEPYSATDERGVGDAFMTEYVDIRNIGEVKTPRLKPIKYLERFKDEIFDAMKLFDYLWSK